jgi:hypothetical protein
MSARALACEGATDDHADRDLGGVLMRSCVRVCRGVRACVRACVRAYVRVCACVRVQVARDGGPAQGDAFDQQVSGGAGGRVLGHLCAGGARALPFPPHPPSCILDPPWALPGTVPPTHSLSLALVRNVMHPPF